MANAILMAAGLGTRMRPLTLHTPKPLIKVNNVPMIESVILGLKNCGISRIFIVVGYLKEQFNYLCEKFDNVELIHNPYFNISNNISSIYFARDYLKLDSTFICEADLFLKDINIFKIPNFSCYFAKRLNGCSDDWVFNVDSNGFITSIKKGGENCFLMSGIAFFNKSDSIKLSECIKIAYEQNINSNLFWDEVVNDNLDNLSLKILEIQNEAVTEIDTINELNALNNS